MRKLILLLAILIPLIGLSQHELPITKMFDESRPYKTHFVNDGGTMTGINSDRYLKSAYYQSIGDEMQESILFSYLGFAATSQRLDGIYSYIEKIYDTSTTGNGTQTTEASQPYLYGDIVPTQREGMQNPNGDSRYIEHPEISFAADEAWTVTTCLNSNYNSDSPTEMFFGNYGGNSDFRIQAGQYRVYFLTGASMALGTTPSDYGKNQILTLICDGVSSVYLYKDGVLESTITVSDTPILFNAIMTAHVEDRYSFKGTISAHIIRNEALTAAQVKAEADFLLSVYPPIAYKTIETYDIATTSLDVVASSNGTVITEAADNTDWATGAARWRYYSDDSEIGSWGNKLYNKAARDVIIANPPENWHVSTEAELTVIATIDGNNLKVEGTDYWSTANGNNHSGLSAVGSGMVNTDGTFTGINTTVGFWCADSDKALIITDAGAATITSVSANEGYCIRLIEN